MALEKRWEAISPIAFTADGTSEGLVTIDNACDFRVKQKVYIRATGLPNKYLEIKKIESDQKLYVGPISSDICAREDISAYTVALGATIEAPLQNRPAIPDKEHERAVFEEEPVVAKRIIPVDQCGRIYKSIVDDKGIQRFPVDANIGDITIDNINVDINADDGDNIAISRHENPRIVLLDEDYLKTELDEDNYTQIFTHTSAIEDIRYRLIKIKADTYGTFRVKVDGNIKDYFKTSPFKRNCIFEFVEDLEVLQNQVLTVEFVPGTCMELDSFNFFLRAEGYKQP